MDTEKLIGATMTEAQIRQHMGIPDHIELQWTAFGWAMRTPVEPETLPITIGYVKPGCYSSDAQ